MFNRFKHDDFWIMKDQQTSYRSNGAARPTAALIYAPLIIIAVTAALIGASLFIKPEFVISTDQIKYLTIAKNFADGNGAHDLDEPHGTFSSFRIGYTFFLASVIRIFGASEGVVVAMNYAIFFAFVVGVYLLGLRLFGIVAGTLGALLMITVPEVIAYGPRNLDAFWPLLVITSTLLLICRAERRGLNETLGLTAGFVAGYAILVKETTVFFMAAPIVLALARVRPPNTRRVISFYIGTAVVALFWILTAVYYFKLPVRSLWTGTAFNDLPLTGGALDYMASLANGLLKYIHNPEARRQSFVLTRLPLAGIMIAAFGWSVWRAIKGDSSHKTLLLVFALFLPLSAFAGAFGMRFHQNFLFLVILCILLGAALETIWNRVHRRFPSLLKPRYLAVAALLTISGMAINLLSSTALKTAREHFEYSSANARGLEIIYGGNENTRALNSLPDGAVIVGDFFGEQNRSVYVFGKGRPTAALPIRQYSPFEPIPPGACVVVNRIFKDTARRDDSIFILDGDAFRETLARTNASYVAIPGGMAAVAEWIAGNIGAVKIMTFPRRNEPPDMLIMLNKDETPSPRQDGAGKIYISAATVKMLSRLKTEDPDLHDNILEWLLWHGMKLDAVELAKLLRGVTQSARYSVVAPPPF